MEILHPTSKGPCAKTYFAAKWKSNKIHEMWSSSRSITSSRNKAPIPIASCYFNVVSSWAWSSIHELNACVVLNVGNSSSYSGTLRGVENSVNCVLDRTLGPGFGYITQKVLSFLILLFPIWWVSLERPLLANELSTFFQLLGSDRRAILCE